MTILAQKLENVAFLQILTFLEIWGLDYRGSKEEMQGLIQALCFT
jgi:hypothetical protein